MTLVPLEAVGTSGESYDVLRAESFEPIIKINGKSLPVVGGDDVRRCRTGTKMQLNMKL